MDSELVKELTEEELKEVAGGVDYQAPPFKPQGCNGWVQSYVSYKGYYCYYYTVASGDTISQICLSLRNESGWDNWCKLARFNNGGDPNVLNLGPFYVPTGAYYA